MAHGGIGLFDSGVGGLTVAAEVYRLFPGERLIYFGDTARVPYGGRTRDELIAFADQIIAFLCSQGARYIIFACNTSSAVSLPVMRERFAVPMMGLIEPGAAEAVRRSKNGNIGLIATEATVNAGAYSKAIKEINPDCRVLSKATPRLVPLVEAGELHSPQVEQVVREYMEPFKNEGIDTLVLGCTHYPFLRSVIQQVLGPEVNLVDPAGATVCSARQDMLQRELMLDNPGPQPDRGCREHQFFVSGQAAGFMTVGRQFLGREPKPVTEICLLD